MNYCFAVTQALCVPPHRLVFPDTEICHTNRIRIPFVFCATFEINAFKDHHVQKLHCVILGDSGWVTQVGKLGPNQESAPLIVGRYYYALWGPCAF